MIVRVVVADDHDLVRAGVVSILASDPEIQVVAECSDGPTAVAACARLAPDVVLMDVQMPGGDGITATQAILATQPAVRVAMLTMFDLDEYVVGALRAGASGFLLKTTPPYELIDRLKACARGDFVAGPTVMARLVDSFVSRPGTDRLTKGLDSPLTDRERDVLGAMARGLSNAEIAADLYLAETTVKTHVSRILDKLGVRDRVQAVVAAHRDGLV